MPPKVTKAVRKANGKSAVARGTMARKARSMLDQLSGQRPNLKFHDGVLKPPVAKVKSGKANPPGTTPGQQLPGAPDGTFGRLKAAWLGVDAFYGGTNKFASPKDPSIELTDAPGGTSLRLRRGSDLFGYLGEYAKKAGLWIGISDALPGRVELRAGDAQGRIVLDAADSSLVVRAADGSVRALLVPTEQGCRLQLFDDDGLPFAYLGDFDAYGGLALGGADRMPGRIVLRKGNFSDEIVLDAQTGDITLMNADCAEEFDVVDDPQPGTVLVLDDEPGRLRASDSPYDTRVAGVVSGAGDYRPAIVLDRRGSQAGRAPVAMVGKVACLVDADAAPVRPGDLLTTSARPGFAMVATDRDRSFGAVLGKALAPMDGGCGLVPVLVALQ